ncbi:MAG: hypothetical protein IT430_19660 [Phycisphaerales bacterium]|nr:hypothetical protein [Phycisphaerales bacterium]
MREDDARSLADALRRDFDGCQNAPQETWDVPPPIKVIDCVLSLNRPYRTVVEPRVRAFRQAHPGIQDCAGLRNLMLSHATPGAFLSHSLQTNDARRAATLLGVTDYVVDIQQQFPAPDEEQRLRAWGTWARPGDYLAVGVRGFGLAGFQYLRMLFGADTVKPDVHVCRYVSSAIGRQVGEVEALYLVERAAKLAAIPVARADAAIWNAAQQ